MPVERTEPLVVAAIASIGKLGVSGVAMGFSVNGIPSCNVAYQTGEGVQDVFSGDVAEELSKLQAANFSERDGPDASVVISEAIGGGVATFAGLTAGPGYSVFAGAVKKSVTLVSPAALLDTLQLGIYTYDHQDMFSVDKLNTGASWAERILAAVEFLVDRGSQKFRDYSGADRAQIAEKHARNTRIGLPILRKILNDSAVTTKSKGLEDLESGGSSTLALNNGIANAILGALLQPSERFWQTLDLLASMFHLIYVPDELYGKLINASEAVDSEPREISPSIGSVEFKDNGGGILPVAQVLIRAAALTTWPRNADPDRQIIDGWPESPVSAGLDTTLPLPGWLTPADSLGPVAKPQPVPVGPPGISDPLDITSYKGGSSTVVARARKAINPIVRQFIRDYARSSWLDRALTRSSVSFSVKLTPDLRPGYRFRVLDPLTKKPLFTGFLASVTHSVEVASGEGGGRASTSLQFTHVEMGSFSLPGK